MFVGEDLQSLEARAAHSVGILLRRRTSRRRRRSRLRRRMSRLRTAPVRRGYDDTRVSDGGAQDIVSTHSKLPLNAGSTWGMSCAKYAMTEWVEQEVGGSRRGWAA